MPADRVRLRINTVTGLDAAVSAGLGIGPLPCFAADANPALRRLSGPHPELGADLWVLTHPDLRHAARVRVFMEHCRRGDAAAAAPLRGPLSRAQRISTTSTSWPLTSTTSPTVLPVIARASGAT